MDVSQCRPEGKAFIIGAGSSFETSIKLVGFFNHTLCECAGEWLAVVGVAVLWLAVRNLWVVSHNV